MLPVVLMFAVLFLITVFKPWELLSPDKSGIVNPSAKVLVADKPAFKTEPVTDAERIAKCWVGMSVQEWKSIFGEPYNIAVFNAHDRNLRFRGFNRGDLWNFSFSDDILIGWSYHEYSY